MALELKRLELTDKMFPVMIGDVDDEDNPTSFGRFFDKGCLPNAATRHVTSIEEKLRVHMAKQALGTLIEESKAVKEVLGEITAC